MLRRVLNRLDRMTIMFRLTLLATLLASGASQAAPAYAVTKSILLGAPDRWDYVSFDAASHRVLVAHSDHTDVIDAGTGAILGKLAGLAGAHGQVSSADGTIWADSGKTAQVTAFDPKSFGAEKSLPAGEDADGVVADPSGKLVIVLDGDAQKATVIDAASRSVRSTIPLGGSPEFAAADNAGHLYVNIASTREVASVDLAAGRVAARYSVPDCLSPHGLAIDGAIRRLFVSCANARLQVLDADSGHVLQGFPIGHGTDAAAFDPVRRIVFSSNGDGTLSMFHEDTSGRLTSLGDVKTQEGARTMAVDPASGRVFLVTAELDGAQPPPEGGRVHYKFKPGSVKLMFLDPAAK